MKTNKLFIFVLTTLSLSTFSQSESDSSLSKVLAGDDNYSLILDFYQNNKSVLDDSLYKLLSISNESYLRNDKRRKAIPDLQFRQISFSDQLFRAKCYFHQLLDYSTVQKNDIELQKEFLRITQNHSNLNLLTNTAYQETFDILLLHSVTTLETGFFVNNFYKYSKAFNNNFKESENLKTMIDLYLSFKYKKQYFETEYGKSKLPDNTFGLLPKMTHSDFKEVLTDLKIKKATY